VRIPALLRSSWLRWFVAVLLFLGCAATFPRWWCGVDGQKWFTGESTLTASLAREVATTVDRGVSANDFTSDSLQFRHEWQFGTYQMAALGLLQVCNEHPELRDQLLPVAERAIDRLLSAEIRAFDARRWGEDPLSSLDGPAGHAAYLGYVNIVLALHRRVTPQSRFAELNDRISLALARRLRGSPAGILETYPGEAYPVDNASIFASLVMHRTISGAVNDDVISAMRVHYQKDWRDPRSHLLFQAVDVRDGRARDQARASGTALAAYFLSLGEPVVAASLFQAVRTNLVGSFLGFGYVDEYPRGIPGKGDIDSGPVILGVSPSGTGFTLASCRTFHDRDLFVQLYRTVHLAGAPVSFGDRRMFVTGGPLGNAIMLAMLTAQPAEP
jgi:hypothetical protein